MEAGDIMHEFYTLLFQQVTSLVMNINYDLSPKDYSKCVHDILFVMCLLHSGLCELHIFRESSSVHPGICFNGIFI
jgi:hypothetical protein